MCFSVNVNLVKEELENRFGATLIDPDNYRPSYYYHAFALPEIPAILAGDSSKIHLLRWGLIPSWTKNISDANIIRYKTFNARSETIETKPSFSSFFRSKRCIIPVMGFFEWQHAGNEKVPWYIYNSENEIFSIAGLYDEWTENNTGEFFTTFSIITTDANSLMAEIHNSAKRMPVILDKQGEQAWLNISSTQTECLELMKPCRSELLKAHTIGPLVNDKTANRNTPDVIKPVERNKPNLLF